MKITATKSAMFHKFLKKGTVWHVTKELGAKYIKEKKAKRTGKLDIFKALRPKVKSEHNYLVQDNK